jgi:hypothetical protein
LLLGAQLPHIKYSSGYHNNNNNNNSNTAHQQSHHISHSHALSGPQNWNVTKYLNRVYLWHKDTDPGLTPSMRIQSAGYYQDLKILTSEHGKPFRGCIDRIFDLRHDPYEHNNLMSADARQCPVSFKKYDSASLVSLLAHNGAVSKHCVEDAACIERYNAGVVERMLVIMPKLKAFVLHGSDVFDNYMRNDLKKATCSVPVVSEVKPIDFGSQECLEKLECTAPLF